MFTLNDKFELTLNNFKYFVIDDNDDEITYPIHWLTDAWYAWKWSHDMKSFDYEHPMSTAELDIDHAIYERGQWYVYVRFYPDTAD